MRTLKLTFLIGFLGLALAASSQLKLGVKIAPGLSMTRAETNSATFNLEDTGSALRFIGGVLIDYPFSENYYFSTGLNYVSRNYKFEHTSNFNQDLTQEVYNLQQIQLPITLKLYTNEVALDKRVYFQFGTAIDIKVDDNLLSQTDPVVTKLGLFDVGLILGSGLEMGLGTNTSAFGGIIFQRNFINAASEVDPNYVADGVFSMRTSFLGLEVGVKF